jgi:hypothetical protein
VRLSIVSGGVIVVAGTALLCALLPRFWAYDAGPADAQQPVSA